MIITVKELAEYIPVETMVSICDSYGFVTEFAQKKLSTCRFADYEVFEIIPMGEKDKIGIQLCDVCPR